MSSQKKSVKAVALISGGLDSLLAAKLVQNQGISVQGIYFTTPFTAQINQDEAVEQLKEIANQVLIFIQHISLGQDYIDMVRNTKYGYGSGLNPCIDCKIFMLKRAWEYAQDIGARFLITGDVLGQRPMSQNKQALQLIEKEADLQGKILRPLSAKLLPKTEAEKKGWVDSSEMLSIQGRGRTEQMELAEKYEITEYETPAGGCPLTEKEYSRKVQDLFNHQEVVTERDVELLKIGRHFRVGESKVIVGRNKEENGQLLAQKEAEDIAFDVAGIPSPVTLALNNPAQDVVKKAAQLTARYSDAESEKVVVSYGKAGFTNEIRVEQLNESQIEKWRI